MANLKDYINYLSKKIYLSPSDAVTEDCLSHLKEIQEDVESLIELDTTGDDIFYSRDYFSFCTTSEINSSKEVENFDLLEKLVKEYGFRNIKKDRGKK